MIDKDILTGSQRASMSKSSFLFLKMYFHQMLVHNQVKIGCFSFSLAECSLSLSHVYIEGLWNALQHIS